MADLFINLPYNENILYSVPFPSTYLIVNTHKDDWFAKAGLVI